MKLSAQQIAQVRQTKKTSVTGSMISTAEADETALHELELYMNNTAELYPQKLQILMNLKKKIDSGKYDPALAPKLWSYWINEGVKRYEKEFMNSGEGKVVFSPETKKLLADQLAKQYEQEIRAGEHDQAQAAWTQLCASIYSEKPSLWGDTMNKIQAAVDMEAIVQEASPDLKEFVSLLIDYDRNVEAEELIERCDDSDVKAEIADSSVDVYNKALLEWVSADLSNAAYVEQALDEGMIDPKDKEFSFWKLLMSGQYLYNSEKLNEAAEWLKEHLAEPAAEPAAPVEPEPGN